MKLMVMRQYLKRFGLNLTAQSQRGSALIVVLVLIPLLTAGGLAVYTSNSPDEYTLNVTAEDTALYAARTGVSQVVDALFNTAGTSPEDQMSAWLAGAAVGDVVGSFADRQISMGGLGTGRSYAALNSRYKATWASVDPANPRIRVEARVFNNPVSGFGAAGRLAQISIIQTFRMGDKEWGTSVTGCAGKYDYWAGNDYKQAAMFSLGGNEVYYTGDDWTFTSFMPSFAQPYIDAGDDATRKLALFSINICGQSRVDCNFNPKLTLGGAIGPRGYGADGIPNNADDVNWINVCGATTESTAAGVADAKLPYAQSWEAHVLNEVTNGSGNLADSSHIGHFHYLDVNNNGLPDSPYFYYSEHNGSDRDLNEPLPFSFSMFKNKEVYIYVKGSVRKFEFGSGSFLNFKKMNVIAKKDIYEFSMMDMSMASSGVSFIAGRDFISGSMMEMSGLSNVSILANRDIKKSGGMWNMNLAGRTHFVAGHNIEISAMMNFNFAKRSGDPNLVCDAHSTVSSEPVLSLGIQYPN